jgi:hypothetical protein
MAHVTLGGIALRLSLCVPKNLKPAEFGANALAQDDEMIHALAPDRSDHSFDKAILPGRGRRYRLVPDAQGSQSACDDGAIDLIPIADEVARHPIPRECFRYLMRDPFCCRICCDVDPDKVSAV